jgi:regulator of sigma E protease
VEVFSLGFGKKLLSYKKGDTTYCISLIPLGGYVKMYGDEIGSDIPEKEKQYSFTHKPVLQRIAVVLAGPMMNFFFAILVFFLVAQIGEEVRSPLVGDVTPGSIAAKAGVQSGDLILEVNSVPVKSWDDVQKNLQVSKNRSATLKIKHLDGAEQQIEAITEIVPNPNPVSLDDYIAEIQGLGHASKAASVGVLQDSILAQVGLQNGDVITMINDTPVKYFRSLESTLQKVSSETKKLNFQVQRLSLDEKKNELKSFQIELKDSIKDLKSIGLESSELYLAKVMDGSPAQKAGLMVADRILEINGTAVQYWEQVLQSIKSFSGTGSLSLKVRRGLEVKELSITPTMTTQSNGLGNEEKRFTIGIIPYMTQGAPTTTVIKADGFFNALHRGFQKTIDVSVMTAVSFLKLIQNKISPKHIGGVIAIGQAASETFKIGISHFLQMMGLISINLFILNLLPIPVLDGGHLLFYIIEALRGTPVSMRKMEIAQQIGLFLLMSLMLLSLFNDFTRIISN